MPQRLSRKRYTEVVRYLKAVIDDSAKSDKLRMTAVQSLLEVYARHDRTEYQKQHRKAAETPDEPEETPESLIPDEGTRLQAQNGKLNVMDKVQEYIASIKVGDALSAKAEHQADESLKVCTFCFRKQATDRETCELCETEGQWEAAASDVSNPQRDKKIAAATVYTMEQLKWHIENGLDTALAAHCRAILHFRAKQFR